MAVRVSDHLAKAYSEAQGLARLSRQQAQDIRGRITSGNFRADRLLAYGISLVDTHRRLGELGSIASLPDYARDQEGDPTYDVVAEYAGLRTRLAAARDYIYQNLPRQAGTDYVLILEVNATTFVQTSREFAPAQIAPLVPLLDDIIAFINVV